MQTSSQFFFVICQTRSNDFCKFEIAQELPDSQLAFSRPGFLTFKAPDALHAVRHLNSNSTFVRSSGLSLGGKRNDDGTSLISFAVDAAAGFQFDHLHVFEREYLPPGKNQFEPGRSELASEVGRRISAELSKQRSATDAPIKLNQVGKENDSVMDVVLIEPNHWWIGNHTCQSIAQRWPGGIPLVKPKEVVSRAYFKMHEALAWSLMPIHANDLCVEIGSAPGGSCQRILEDGAKVLAIDPAELDERISGHRNLVHIQRRAKDVKRKWIEDAKWLICDANIAPVEVFSTLEAWFNDGIQFRGMILTLKIARDEWVNQIAGYRKRVQELGFRYVRTRQLAFNRNEICLLALKNKAVRRFG